MVQYLKLAQKYLLHQQKGEHVPPGNRQEKEGSSDIPTVHYDPDAYEGNITNPRERPSTKQTLKAQKEREQKEALANPRKGQN